MTIKIQKYYKMIAKSRNQDLLLFILCSLLLECGSGYQILLWLHLPLISIESSNYLFCSVHWERFHSLCHLYLDHILLINIILQLLNPGFPSAFSSFKSKPIFFPKETSSGTLLSVFPKKFLQVAALSHLFSSRIFVAPSKKHNFSSKCYQFYHITKFIHCK